MMFHRKPPVGCGDEECLSYPAQFSDEGSLRPPVANMFDDRVTKHDIERCRGERQRFFGLHALIDQPRVTCLQVRAVLRSDTSDPLRIGV